MANLVRIAGAGTLALLALVFALSAQASAKDGLGCAPTTGFVPQFCLNIPVGASARHEATVPLSTVLTARADVRVESGIPAPEVLRLASSADAAITRVEQVFDRPFTTRPRILVFATRASFARGTQDLFGYSPETAASVAATYGGVFDPQTLTVAVSWPATTGSHLSDLLAHELTHLAMREIVGPDAALPTWFEEGLAAEIQAGDVLIDDDARLAARSFLANAPGMLGTIATLPEWHNAYTEIGVGLYAVSAEAVRAIEAQLGRGAILSLLTDVAGGTRFEDAYGARAGESLDEFFARFTGALALRPTVTIGMVADASGNLRWTLGGFAPDTDVRMTITGQGYDLAYMVRTDAIGMYRGSFGSTAARGTYTLTAETANVRVTATMDTASR